MPPMSDCEPETITPYVQLMMFELEKFKTNEYGSYENYDDDLDINEVMKIILEEYNNVTIHYIKCLNIFKVEYNGKEFGFCFSSHRYHYGIMQTIYTKNLTNSSDSYINLYEDYFDHSEKFKKENLKWLEENQDKIEIYTNVKKN